MPSEFVLIANPTSGSQRAPMLATRVAKLLSAQSTVELKLTAARGDAFRFAAEACARGAVAVAGCGGDGTLQEIATALENSSTAMGILPSGRCNDFAGALGLSKADTPECLAAVLLGNKRRAVDLGCMGSKRFLTVATLGFDSQISRFVETHKLWLKGTPAYMYGLACVLSGFRAPHVRLKGDFGTYEGRILLVATGNTARYGGAMHIVPGAQPDDGLFHLCVVGEISRLTVLRVLPMVLSGAHVTHPAVKMMSTRVLEIETGDGAEWVCADGESLGQTPCRLEVRAGALTVLVPNDGASII